MASELFRFYDLFVIGAVLIALYSGAKRGFMRSVVLVLLMAASVAVSWFVCTVAAPVIYENFIQDRVLTALTESSEKTDPVAVVSQAITSRGYGVEMTGSEVEGVISQAGDFFENIAAEIKSNGAGETSAAIETGIEETVTESMLKALVGDVVSPSTLREILESVSNAENSVRSTVDVFINGDRSATAKAVESELVAPAVKMLLKGIIWVVMMFILAFVSRTAANAFKGLNRVPIIGPVNVLLGAGLGLAEGLVIIYMIAQLVRLVCYFTSNSLMFLNTDTVSATGLFRYFFYFDIMTIL